MEKEHCSSFLMVGRRLVLPIFVCLLLVVIVSKNAFSEDTSGAGNTSCTVISNGVIAYSVVTKEADAQATQKTEEDPRKRQQKDQWVDATGAFQYKYSLNLPEGTNNMAPELTLAYNSNVGNGIMGMGWFLQGISEIQRDFNYDVKYTADDHFTYNGEKLIKASDGYYHMQRENFERIEYNSSQNYWVATQKSGTKLYYGYKATEHSDDNCGRIKVANDTSRVLLWSLSKVVDIHGNYYIIEYNQDNTGGDYYPVKITYTKNERKPLQAGRTIEFSYELRDDHYVMYRPTKQDMDHRLKWITVKMNGKLLRKWQLDYAYGASTKRSKLTQIQEYGNDGNWPDGWEVTSKFIGTGKTLPPLKLTWSQDNFDNFFKKTANFNLTNIALGRNDGTIFSFIGDFNGDGQSDCLIGRDNPSYNCLYLSNGDGSFTKASNFNITCYLGHSNGTQFSWIGDFNGDGKSDILHGGNDTSDFNCLYLSNGDGSFTKASNFNIGSYLGHSNETQFSWIGDFNGDGKSDVLHGGNDVSKFNSLYLSNGDGSFTKASNFNIWTYLGHSNRTQFSWIGDFNGDGKSDVLHGGNDVSDFNSLYLSNGDGSFTKASNFNIWTYLGHSNGTQFSWVGDFNGDGKSDVLHGGNDVSDFNSLYLSNGDGSFTKASNFNIWTYLGHSNGTQFSWLGDFNGDGKSDILHGGNDLPFNSLYLSNLNLFDKPVCTDVLTRIDNSIGLYIDVTYNPAPQVPGAISSTGKTYPNIANTSPTPLVTELMFQDLFQPSIIQTYKYSNSMFRMGLPHERVNLGFQWIELVKSDGSAVRNYYHQDDQVLRMLVDKEEVFGFDGKLYTLKSYAYQKRENNPGIKIIYPENEYLKNYNGEDGMPVTYQVEYGYDAYGNQTLVKDYGDIAITGDETRTERNYNQYLDSAAYLFLPEYERKYGVKLNGQEGLAAETRYFYNINHTLEREEKENGDQDVAIQYGYDDYGNIISKIDGNNNRTTYVYDDKYATFLRYETSKFTTETVYDDLMRPVNTVDANGQIWETTYDVFSREKSKIAPGDSAASPTTKVSYPDEFVDADGNSFFPLRQKTEKKVADGNYIENYTYYDGLNRMIQEKTESKNGWITVDHLYDGDGRESQTSMPYFSTTWEYTAPDSNVKFITNVYDPIGRLAEVIKPDNTSIRQYYGKYDNITVDELGHVSNQRIEGNIEYDIKYTGIYPSHTEYSRTTKITACDGTKIIDPLQKVFTTGLDMLERTVSATSPMNGTWTYVYDGNDNMISRTDAKNQTMLFEYDIMNRMTKKTYPDGSYVSYYFDETGHGYAKGRQTRIVYPGGSESYTYDVRGRKTAITQTISGLSRTKTMTYNSMDQLTSQSYPDGEVLNYTYDAGGLLSKLNGATTYVNDINYFASDKISKMDFGNGVQTEYDYYDTASESDSSAGTTFSYRLRQIRVNKPGSEIFNLNYEYEKNDNLKVKRDLSNNKFTETYGYDDLNRLISAASTSYGSKTYQYDVLNNILRKDNRTYQYDTANPYKLLNDGRYTYIYDANGSIIRRGDGLTLGWDYENRLASVSGGNAYAYNADEQRIKKTENGVTTYYFFNDYEEEYTGGVKSKSVKYYFADKQRVAERSSVDGVHYYHQDHLSSSTAITDASGNLISRHNYAPYGEDAVSDGNASVKYKFSDKEKDIPGFYYFGARYYDPVLGRFISVDPAKQELNWYAYCGNNPVKYVDPDGEFFDAIFDAIGIAWDIVEIAANPSNPISWVSLAADVGCLFIPGATGAGSAIKAADKAANIGKAIKTADKTKDVVGLVEKGNRIVGAYNNVKKVIKGTVLQAHHLIEKRFASVLGITNTNTMLSVALTKTQHKIFTDRWRMFIPYGTKLNDLSPGKLLEVAKKVYNDAPELLKIVESSIKSAM